MEKKNVLVTGVTGQVGSWAADFLLEKGYKVYGFHRRTSNEHQVRIAHLKNDNNFELIEGDLTDATSVLSAVKLIKPEIMMNYGAMSFVATSFKEPVHTMYATGISAINCLEAIRTESPLTRFIQSSSSEMFGSSYDTRGIGQKQDANGNMVPIFEKYQDENTKMNPVSPYAVAKLAAHHYVKLYRQSYNLHACSSIAMNHESYRRGLVFFTRKVTNYIGQLIRHSSAYNNEQEYLKDKIKINCKPFYISKEKALSFRKLKLGNLESYRDFSHAWDIVNANYLMAMHTVPDDFLVASGTSRKVKDFLQTAFDYVGLDYKDYVIFDESLLRPCEVDYLRGDPSKIKMVLGWQPKYSFEDLVKEMVEWDINNGN